MKLLLKAVTITLVAILSFPPISIYASVANWQKGISIYSTSTNVFESLAFQETLDNLKATGANYVSLIIPIYQADVNSSDIFAGWDTPTDESLISGIQYAKSIGLKVMLKPHLESQKYVWRANINPWDRERWYQSYRNWIVKYLEIADTYGADAFVLGTELYHVTSPKVDERNRTFWNNLINEARTIYGGLLTYDAQFPSHLSERDEVDFWPKLDFVGISAYYNLAPALDEPTVQDLMNSWKFHERYDLTPFYNRVKKDIVFTEIGYRSVEDTHKDPWDAARGGSYAPEDQEALYQAFFQYWSNIDYFKGVHLWNWLPSTNAGGSGNTDYTTQNKPALETITNWFSQSGTGEPDIPEDTTDLQFDYSSTINPSTPLVMDSVQIVVSIRPNKVLNNLIVDLEIYTSQGEKVHQEFFENQNLSANQNNNFNTSFIPMSQGDYILKIGIFTSNWSQNLNWNDRLDTLIVANEPSEPDPEEPDPVDPDPAEPDPEDPEPPSNPEPPVINPSGEVQSWWPVENVTLSGLQPFKALMQTGDLNQYKMYWQVDNGNLNEMWDSYQDAPHKEALVDLSGWSWNNAGPYNITFIVKDLNGNIIQTKEINIFVAM